MYPVVGNSSADDQKKPVAKYIHTDLLNSTRKFDIPRRLGIPSTGTGEISPSKEDKDVCIPKERLLAGVIGRVGDNQNGENFQMLQVRARLMQFVYLSFALLFYVQNKPQK
jgi:hypothetical protein